MKYLLPVVAASLNLFLGVFPVLAQEATESSVFSTPEASAAAFVPTPSAHPTPLPTPTPVSTVDSCRTDINGDGITDLSDVMLFSSDFVEDNPDYEKSDVNQDGLVDLSDYSLIVGNFLSICR